MKNGLYGGQVIVGINCALAVTLGFCSLRVTLFSRPSSPSFPNYKCGKLGVGEVGEPGNKAYLNRQEMVFTPPSLCYFGSVQVKCCECVCSGQMIVSGGTAGVVSFWQIINTPQVAM